MRNLFKSLTFLFIVGLFLSELAGCSVLGIGNPKQPLPPLPEVKPSIGVKTLWSVSTGSGAGKDYLRLTPDIHDGHIYTVDAKGHVSAYAVIDGRRLWGVKLKQPISAGPGAGNDKVFVATSDAKLYALDGKTGAEKWHVNIPNQVLANPVYADNKVIIKTIDSDVVALDADNGKEIWKYNAHTPRLIIRASSEPIVSHGGVIVGFSDGKVNILTLEGGHIVWNKQVAESQGFSDFERMVDIDAKPMVMGDTLYVVTYQGNISAFNLRTGQLRWRHKISSYTGMTVDPLGVYVSDAGGRIWAFDAQTGRVTWRQNSLNYREITAPVLVDGYLMVADTLGYTHWLSPSDGRFVARQKVANDGVIAPPLASGNTVYLFARNGRLFALQPHIL